MSLHPGTSSTPPSIRYILPISKGERLFLADTASRSTTSLHTALWWQFSLSHGTAQLIHHQLLRHWSAHGQRVNGLPPTTNSGPSAPRGTMGAASFQEYALTRTYAPTVMARTKPLRAGNVPSPVSQVLLGHPPLPVTFHRRTSHYL